MKPSIADHIVAAALESDGLELFSNDHDGYASITVDGHRETWAIRSTMFRRWLSGLLFETHGKTPGGQALMDSISVLEGIAVFKGAEDTVHLRFAEYDGELWLDLGDPKWRAVKIVAGSWRVVDKPPVRFRRPRGMLSLPDPEHGGSLSDLRDYVNADDDDWILFQSWLLGALHPRGPYPLLVITGEQGSCKSTAARVARALSDPNEAPLRREPREGRDLVVAARNGWVVAFDNVSRLSQELSDDLARLSTGAGFSARQLYTDLEETIVHVARPAILNGIEDFVTRGDLLDRSVIMDMQPIEVYRDEKVFWSDFEAARPALLGALLDAVATALARHNDVPTPNIRMADYARWAAAAEPALDCAPDAFMRAYRKNRAGAWHLILEASIIAGPVQKLVAAGDFEGTATDLLARIADYADEETRKQREWPKRPHTLGGQLKRIAPALRRVGTLVEYRPRNRASRIIRITKVAGT